MTDPLTFTTTTPRHPLPLLFAGQSQKEFFVNEALARLDALIEPVAEAISDTPPSAPATGQSWLIGTSPTGVFDGRTGSLATWDGSGFCYVRPAEGMRVRVRGSGTAVLTDGAWIVPAQPEEASGGITIDEEARGAIATVIAALRVLGIFS